LQNLILTYIQDAESDHKNINDVWIIQSKHGSNSINASSPNAHPGVIKFKGHDVNGTIVQEIFQEAEEILQANLHENRLKFWKCVN